MICKKLHHAAYRCDDAGATVAFYTDVLGLKFTHVMGDDHVPSTKAYDPHIHLFFELADGSCIAFFEVPKAPEEGRNRNDWVQHFAIEVDSMDTLLAAKSRIEAKGIKVLGPTDHEGFMQSIYFRDPSGHRLELTVNTATPEMVAEAHRDARMLLDRWQRSKNWSEGAPHAKV